MPEHDIQSCAHSIRYFRNISEINGIPLDQQQALSAVESEYPFRANEYYLSLIDWADPADPIRRIIVPHPSELTDFGHLDASNESAVFVCQGVQHKYPNTVLLLCSDVCGGCCRYCFRKRLFLNGSSKETISDISQGIQYISEHPEVTNVLLTGGDPLMLSTGRLAGILAGLRAIPHVKIIRIGSKLPAFNPWRILEDAELRAVLRQYSEPGRRIYLMAHFDHPRELTDAAIAGIDAFITSGVICVNQCPLIRGVNDDPAVLSDLYRRLSFIGCPPYYLFQCRPAVGNKPYTIPIVRGWDIFREAIRRGSGLARRPRYVMSHASGKVEIVGVDERHIYLRFQCAKDPDEPGRLIRCDRNDEASWFDELTTADDSEWGQTATAN